MTPPSKNPHRLLLYNRQPPPSCTPEYFWHSAEGNKSSRNFGTIVSETLYHPPSRVSKDIKLGPTTTSSRSLWEKNRISDQAHATHAAPGGLLSRVLLNSRKYDIADFYYFILKYIKGHPFI